jgi:hypothetical protein
VISPVNKKLQNLQQRALQKNGAAEIQRADKRQSRRFGVLRQEQTEHKEISSRPIWNCYMESAKKYDMLVPGWERKEMAIAKRFAQKVGSMERAIRIVEYIFEHWTELVKKWKLEEGSNPTINLISTYGMSLVNKSAEPKKVQEISLSDGNVIRSFRRSKNG